MITYQKTTTTKIHRATTAQSPFWAAASYQPYGPFHDTPVAINYVELTAASHARLEVAVAPMLNESIERGDAELREPLFIDASTFAERVYARGEAAIRACDSAGISTIAVFSADSTLPLQPVTKQTTLVISCWPFDEKKIEAAFIAASECAPSWGAAIPILYPVTTRLDRLAAIADRAARHRAAFFTSIPLDLDPTAKHAIAEMMKEEMDEETYQALFHSDLETIGVATERHIAALAAERAMSDSVLAPGRASSNWNAAVALALRGTRMVQMKKDVELGWDLLRSARVIAELPKSVETIAQTASLSIIESIHPLAADALSHWLQSGKSEYFDDIDREWRLRRDHLR